jgi:predicted MFS family arabinose efflux permease
MTLTVAADYRDDAGVWITLRESPLPVRAMLVGVLVNELGGFLQTFLVLFLTARGFSEVQAGVALGSYGAGCFVGILVGGSFSDRLGPRTATFASMAGFAGFLLAVLYLRYYPMLVIAVALTGIAGKFYRPAAASMLSELTAAHRQVMIAAVYRLAINVGTTAAPLLGTLLISVSYELLFWCDAITAVLYGVIAIITLPRQPIRPREPDAAARRATGYRALLIDRRYLLFLTATFVNCVVYIQYVSTLPLAMKDAGLAMAWYSLAISLNGFVVITSELVVTKITQRLPVRLIVTAGFVLLAVGQLMYALPWGAVVFIGGTLVWTVAEITAGPTMFSYPGRIAPAGLRGRYIASMQTMFSLGAAVGPAVGVAVYRAVGAQLWVWCALASLFGLVLALLGMHEPDAAGKPAAVAGSPPGAAMAGLPDGVPTDGNPLTAVSAEPTPATSPGKS